MPSSRRHAFPRLRSCGLACLAALLAAGAGAQGLQTWVAYPADTTTGTMGNNAPLGRNGNAAGATDEARAQILIPAQFLPPAGGTVIGIEMVNGAAAGGTLTYASLDIHAANLPSTGPFPALNPTYAVNLGANPVTVYSQQNVSITWPSRAWTRVTFSTPFPYQGGDHLVLDFQKAVACPASGAFYHLTDTDARTQNNTVPFNLPIMMVSFGVCGSGAHLLAANTSTGPRHPPRVRVVFQGSPTQCAASLSGPTTNVSAGVVIGGSFTIETQADVNSWGVQLVELYAPHLVSRAAPLVIPGVCGAGWVTPGVPTLLAVGTGLFPGTSHVSTMTVPFAPAFVGMHLGFQSLLLSAPTMAPIWSNATDATVL